MIVEHSSVESHLYRALHPDHAGWTRTNMLLAAIADALAWLQWAKTKDGRKNRNRPDPIERPGVEPKRKAVHPGAKGVVRSKIRQILGHTSAADKAKRLADLFSGKE
ncbi:hypothetical protein A5720_11955 [Mycolicibacterium conceptionense]|uniref:Uncharacterized protein n=1 Tax=Mycolicibacterium conceptionense TaxID=451644 RepID=A0A1A1ZJB1_9MYCO|nr:hypothetical protein A5726_30025 [Mycolicibacterium conceptionense]OBF43732.1 hypothetical protein A5720_11955 [Mycolicibacterium conceptionense]OBH99370.1 hypothetical protein A5716_00345 [Mycolicibacterium conceptionense]